MTLAEGVAAASGLLDLQADPGSVFLFRREPRELAEKLGVDCSKMDGPTVPVVYSVSFADPAGYFLATRVQMHNKDVIFAANAQAVGVTKFETSSIRCSLFPPTSQSPALALDFWRTVRRRPALESAVAALAIARLAVLHALADFSLQIPGYAIPV